MPWVWVLANKNGGSSEKVVSSAEWIDPFEGYYRIKYSSGPSSNNRLVWIFTPPLALGIGKTSESGNCMGRSSILMSISLSMSLLNISETR